MNRLKVFLLALVSLGAIGYLMVVTPGIANRSIELASGALAGGSSTVAFELEAQRSAAQAAVVKVASSPAAWNVGPKTTGAKEAPNVERFATIRQAVFEALTDANKEQVWVSVVNDNGSLTAQGSADPGPAPEGVDLATLVQAGASGSIVSVASQAIVFYATPLLISDKNEVRTAGTVLVGVPLLPSAKRLESLAKDAHFTTLAIIKDGKVVLAAGTEKLQAEPALKTLKTAGAVAPLSTGPVREVGPITLPLFLAGAPHSVGLRAAIAGTPYEVVTVASTREPLDALASVQFFELLALAGVLLFGVAMTVAVKSGDHDEGGGMVVPPPMPLPPVAVKKEREPTHEMPAQPHGPEASPDDFHFPEAPAPAPSAPPPSSTNSQFAISTPSTFGPPPPPPVSGLAPALVMGTTGQNAALSTGSTGQAPVYEPESDPFESALPTGESAPPFAASRTGSQPVTAVPPPPSKPPPPTSNPFDDDEGARTVAYPVFKPPMPSAPSGGAPMDPFAMASGQSGPYEDNPDTTRVAAVPQELIKAARGSTGVTGERPAVKVTSQPMPKVQSVAPVITSPAGEAEERHFQDVFRDFVATREKCGEAADGLTFDKFKTKLLKNKEQLVAKYQCRTVRFQVYVKEGKAALKATPVKD